MFNTAALLLSKMGPPTYDVRIAVVATDFGPLMDETYKMKIGDSVFACPDYMDPGEYPVTHGFFVFEDSAPSWIKVTYENYGYTVTLISKPQGDTYVSFQADEDGGG